MSTSQKWKLFENGRLASGAGAIRQGSIMVEQKKHRLFVTQLSATKSSNASALNGKRVTRADVRPGGAQLNDARIAARPEIVYMPKHEKHNGSDKRKQGQLAPILLTVAQAATLMGSTQGAIRHMIFNAEAYRSNPSLSKYRGFLECIVRPPGVGRVFIHREKLLNLIASWMGKGDAA
jgi:hypothetical protein